MCNLTDNFMEDHIFYLRLKQEHEYRMWCEFVKQKEEEEKAYDKIAEEHFKFLEQFETEQQEKEYRSISEWDELQTI